MKQSPKKKNNPPPPGHGGPRPGSGRPQAGTRPLLVRPKIETIARMRARAAQAGWTLGQLLDTVFQQ